MLLSLLASIGDCSIESTEIRPCVFLDSCRRGIPISEFGTILCTLKQKYGLTCYAVQVGTDLTRCSVIVKIMSEAQVLPIIKRFIYVGTDIQGLFGEDVYAWRTVASGVEKLYEYSRTVRFYVMTPTGIETITGCDLIPIEANVNKEVV